MSASQRTGSRGKERLRSACKQEPGLVDLSVLFRSYIVGCDHVSISPSPALLICVVLQDLVAWWHGHELSSPDPTQGTPSKPSGEVRWGSGPSAIALRRQTWHSRTYVSTHVEEVVHQVAGPMTWCCSMDERIARECCAML
nr:hypothetical protein CFP56_22424 [Quercus suber]